MPKQNYTHLAVVMDRSGSMSSIAKDMEGGLKNFIAEQKKVEGEATVTFSRFDSEFEMIYDFVPIESAEDFTLQPRGSTALLDAMGRTMQSVKAHIDALPPEEKPDKVVFFFVTDGQENASTEFNRERVFDMISTLRNAENDVNRPDENGTLWDFVFLGANQDAIMAGGNLGIRADASLTYAASAEGSATLFRSLSANMTSYRTKGSDTFAFSASDRDAQNVGKQTAAYANATRSVFVPPIPDLTDYNLDNNPKQA